MLNNTPHKIVTSELKLPCPEKFQDLYTELAELGMTRGEKISFDNSELSNASTEATVLVGRMRREVKLSDIRDTALRHDCYITRDRLSEV